MMEIDVDRMRTDCPDFEIVRETLSNRLLDFDHWARLEVKKLDGRIMADTTGKRMAVAFFLVVAEHCQMLGKGIEECNYASALAIWRPMMEALFKLLQVASVKGPDQEVAEKYRTILRKQSTADKEFFRSLRDAGGPDLLHSWKSVSEWANSMVHGGFGQLNANIRADGSIGSSYPGLWIWGATRSAGAALRYGT